MSFLSKIFGKKEKDYNKRILEEGHIRKGGVNPYPSTSKPKIAPAGQGLRDRKIVEIRLAKEDRRIIKELIKKYQKG